MSRVRLVKAYLTAIRRNWAVVSVLLVGLLMLGGVLASIQALWTRNHSVGSSIREDALWATYQTDREAVKLSEALHEAIDHPTDFDTAKLALRFDILYSRHEVMEDADFPAKFRNDPRLDELTEDVGRILHRLVPIFDRIATGERLEPIALTALEREAGTLNEATERLLSATQHVQAGLQTDERIETSRIYAMLGGAIAAMTLAMSAVIAMIWRQVRQLEIARFKLQRLSEELAQSAASAEAGAKAKSAFLATMSHEIRTPLNGIIGMAELLAATPLDAGQRDRLGTIRQCSDGLVTLINDILDFSKLESGKIDLEHRPMDLGEVIDGVVDMFAPKADSKGIELVACHPSGQWLTDPTRFRQILVNLVGNAVKFTDRGAVAIRVFSTHPSGGDEGLRVVVEDTGIGISRDNQKRLFREFTQADASINRRYGGSGLGLAITRRIVEALGGEIRVESLEGKGTTFWCEIPAEKVDERDLPPTAPMLDVRVEAAAPLVAGVLERGLVLLGHGTHRAVVPEGRRRIVLYDVAAFAHAMLAGRSDRTSEVVVFGHGASAFAAEAAEVVEGAMTSRRLARLLAHLEAGTRWGGDRSPFAGEAVPARPIGHGRVLVAEDNLVNQTVAKGLLARLGFTVEVVGDGARAVERLEREHFDAVLMDMQMPVMDGLEATRRIRAAEAASGRTRVPIVGLTANAFASDREACLAAGMDDFVTKPVTLDKLAEALAGLGSAEAPAPTAVPATAGDAAGSDAPVPVLDRAHRDGLAEVLGAEGLAELTAVFRDDADRLVEDIAAARVAGDREGVRRALHTLKGAAANVGLSGVVAAVDEVRAAGGIDCPDATGRLAAALLVGWRALVEDGAAANDAQAAQASRRA